LPAPLSIIIPTLNSADKLGPTLAALKPGLDKSLIRELIFSDGGSSDDTAAIAEDMGADLVSGPKGRGGQLARGAEAARGEWLLFLHSDTRLSANWAEEVIPHLPNAKQAGYFRLRFDANGLAPRIVSAWANLRSRLFGLPYGDQGLLISRQLYDQIGGFSDLPLMEDVDMARKLKGKLAALPAEAVTSPERYKNAGWLRQSCRNAARLIRYKMGVPVERLMGDYSKS